MLQIKINRIAAPDGMHYAMEYECSGKTIDVVLELAAASASIIRKLADKSKMEPFQIASDTVRFILAYVAKPNLEETSVDDLFRNSQG